MIIKTRENLLNRMEQLQSCYDAQAWVGNQWARGTPALTIWKACPHKDWLSWYLCNVKSARLYASMKARPAVRPWGECGEVESLSAEFCRLVDETRWWSWSLVGDVMTLDELRAFWDKPKAVADDGLAAFVIGKANEIWVSP